MPRKRKKEVNIESEKAILESIAFVENAAKKIFNGYQFGTLHALQKAEEKGLSGLSTRELIEAADMKVKIGKRRVPCSGDLVKNNVLNPLQQDAYICRLPNLDEYKLTPVGEEVINALYPLVEAIKIRLKSSKNKRASLPLVYFRELDKTLKRVDRYFK